MVFPFVQMKICKGWLQALLSPAPRSFAARSRVLARLASLAQIGELARSLPRYLINKLPMKMLCANTDIFILPYLVPTALIQNVL